MPNAGWGFAWLAVAAAGCGRIGFDSGGGSGHERDATASCVADGFCAPGCGASDPDCQTTCGDGQCVGNAGETCKTCMADCATTADVCGNGTCGPGETSATCYVDCGPSPWTWASDETDFLAAINQVRAQGLACGTGSATTAPALAMAPALQAAARDAVWEDAHLGLVTTRRCDGESLITWAFGVGANAYDYATSGTTTQSRIMTATANSCSAIVNASYTKIGIGIAVDQTSLYVLLFR